MAELLDYVVFLLLTGASLAVGAYFSVHKKGAVVRTTDEVFLGSRSLRILPLAMSVLATVGSATGVIGLPAHMYAYGWHLGWLSVSNILLIPIATSVVVPINNWCKFAGPLHYGAPNRGCVCKVCKKMVNGRFIHFPERRQLRDPT
ncbi:hypothetical protein HPB50_027802 [Hyalomma asiaticum]|nr:hypothetical protein HPB50_027802 [Hyalomma asiaticum]